MIRFTLRDAVGLQQRVWYPVAPGSRESGAPVEKMGHRYMKGDHGGRSWGVMSDHPFILGDGTTIHARTINKNDKHGFAVDESSVITGGRQAMEVTGLAALTPGVGGSSPDVESSLTRNQ